MNSPPPITNLFDLDRVLMNTLFIDTLVDPAIA